MARISSSDKGRFEPAPLDRPPKILALGLTVSKCVPRLAICRSISERAPAPTAIMTMTDPTPMMIPSVVSTVRKKLVAMAVTAALRQSTGCMGSTRYARQAQIFYDRAVAEHGTATRVAGDLGLVGDDDDGDPLPVEVAEKAHDIGRRLAIEGAGRLIRQQQLWIIDECARDRDALLLAARKLLRMVAETVAETHLLEPPPRLQVGISRPRPGVRQGQHHLPQRRRARQQVELLEHKADGAVPEIGHGVAGQRADVATVDLDRARGRHIKGAQ